MFNGSVFKGSVLSGRVFSGSVLSGAVSNSVFNGSVLSGMFFTLAPCVSALASVWLVSAGQLAPVEQRSAGSRASICPSERPPRSSEARLSPLIGDRLRSRFRNVTG
ncbi:MAG: hypothetical protein ACKVT1_15545 [Dehalococcoidia bacterium]